METNEELRERGKKIERPIIVIDGRVIKMKDQFDGKIGLVTGAGSGIGRACAVALAIERGALTWLFPSEDVKEGVAAFVEKRKPQFKGK